MLNSIKSHTAQPFDPFGEDDDGLVELFKGLGWSEGDEDGTTSEVGGDADGGEGGWSASPSGETGGSGVDFEALQVAEKGQTLAFYLTETEAQGVRGAGGAGLGTVQVDAWDACFDGLPEVALEVADRFGVTCPFTAGEFGGDAGTHDGGHVFDSRSEAGFLVASVEHGGEARTSVVIKNSNPPRPAEAVCGTGEQGRDEPIDLDVDPSDSSFAIDEDRDPLGTSGGDDFGCGLDRA